MRGAGLLGLGLAGYGAYKGMQNGGAWNDGLAGALEALIPSFPGTDPVSMNQMRVDAGYDPMPKSDTLLSMMRSTPNSNGVMPEDEDLSQMDDGLNNGAIPALDMGATDFASPSSADWFDVQRDFNAEPFTPQEAASMNDAAMPPLPTMPGTGVPPMAQPTGAAGKRLRQAPTPPITDDELDAAIQRMNQRFNGYRSSGPMPLRDER
jgi:hypothetical protein